jgi:hypothetical protein
VKSLLLLTSLTLAAQDPASLTALLRNAPVVHAEFTQTRTLAALSRPLKASGSLVLARDQGVIWELRKPAAITYVMGPKGLLVVTGDGQRARKSAREAPVVAQLGRVFAALIQGDLTGLGEFFTVTGSGNPERWELVLRPKPQTAAFLKRVQLNGGRSIERLRIEEPGGDHMELSFEHPRLDAPLTGAEASLLAD